MMLLSAAASLLQGKLLGGVDQTFSRVVTDSRSIQAGDLFVALRGERFDGHDFAEEAIRQGAVGAIIDKAHTEIQTGPFIAVEDTTLALGHLGAAWRNQMSVKVCAITGSSGKTTVKDMTATILRHIYGADAVLATTGNFNNQIGLPLTLLSLKPTHQFAVLEMGMNHFGEIRYLTKLAKPDVALINNAQGAHLEFLGSVEGVARAKAEIFEGLSENGVAVIYKDDPFAPMWRQVTSAFTQLSFALQEADICAEEIVLDTLSSQWVLNVKGTKIPVFLPAPGLHNIHNALAAAAIAFTCGVDVQGISDGLSKFISFKGRLQQKKASNGAVLIDDTYNANPSSMRAAIDVLAQFSGPRLLILGDMGEVGEKAQEVHHLLGEYAAEKGTECLLTFGDNMRFAVDAFNGKRRGYAEHFTNIEALIARAREVMVDDKVILVKGSRSMRMERVVTALETNNQQSSLGE